MLHCSAAISVAAGSVFGVFLARELTSVALGYFPGNDVLWRLSYSFGYDLLPLLTVLRGTLGENSWATSAVLLGLLVTAIGAFKARNLFLASVSVHLAALSVWFCWLVSLARNTSIYASADIPSYAWKLASQPAGFSILPITAIGLVFACLFAHTSYITAFLRHARSRWCF
jgi:hypothetical protein